MQITREKTTICLDTDRDHRLCSMAMHIVAAISNDAIKSENVFRTLRQSGVDSLHEVRDLREFVDRVIDSL